MAFARHGEDKKRLETEIQRREYICQFRILQKRYQALAGFKTWQEVVAFMWEGESRNVRKEEILQAIFEAHGEDQNPKWRTILLLIFWPTLISIHRQKSRWDSDPEELWQNINWTFLKVVCRIDLRKRRHSLVQKVFNDVVHYLWDEYRRKFVRPNFEIAVDLEELETRFPGVDDIDYEGIDARLEQEAAITRLRHHLAAGRITDEDFLLLVGTRVYGKSAAEYARDTGMDYALARQRRLRAEAAIRRYEDVTENHL